MYVCVHTKPLKDGDLRFSRLEDGSLLVSFDISVNPLVESILEPFISPVVSRLFTREAYVALVDQLIELLVELGGNLMQS